MVIIPIENTTLSARKKVMYVVVARNKVQRFALAAGQPARPVQPATS